MKEFILLLCMALSSCVARTKIKDLREVPAREESSPQIIEHMDKISLELTKVEKDASYWSKGILIGTASRAVTEGVIFKTKEVEFLLAGGIGGEDTGNYSPVMTNFSIYDSKIFDQYKNRKKGEPIVVTYLYRHPLNPFFLTKSRYFAIELNELTDFKKSSAYLKDGNKFTEDPKITKGWYASGTYKGYIVHVSRWGFLGVTCTMFLHEGGEREKTSYDWSYGKVGGVPLMTSGITFGTKSVPNISTLNIYSEEGCKFAEAAAKGQVRLNVEMSRQFVEIWNAHKNIVHSMEVVSDI